MSRTVLVIEDSDTMAELIRRVLNDDVEMIRADNAADGIRTAIDLEPDIILADEDVEGKNAIQICELLKKDNMLDFIPFVVLTGKPGDYNHARSTLAGVDDVIAKPFAAEDFVSRVEGLLGAYADRRPIAVPDLSYENGEARGDSAAAGKPVSENIVEALRRELADGEMHLEDEDGPLEPGRFGDFDEDGAEPGSYEDPIASFLEDSPDGDPEEWMTLPEPGESAREGGGLDDLPEAEPVVASGEHADPDEDGEDHPVPAGPPLTGDEEMSISREELERLVATEIKRRLARIELGDLDREITAIYRDAVDRTVRRMLPQVKTEIILTVVKMLKDK